VRLLGVDHIAEIIFGSVSRKGQDEKGVGYAAVGCFIREIKKGQSVSALSKMHGPRVLPPG